MTTSDITLRSFGVGPKAQLTLDGQDISDQVLALNLWIEPTTHDRRLELYLSPGVMDIELRDVETVVDARTYDALVRLGWTPPTEDKEATG